MTDSAPREAAQRPDLPRRHLHSDHPQPDPASYSTDALIALLLADFVEQSPAQSAALRLLADHRVLLDREDVRHVAVTVIGWRPGQAVESAAFARFDFGQAVGALEEGGLEMNWPSEIVLQFAWMLDGSAAAMQKLDIVNRGHLIRALARAGGMDLLDLTLIRDPFPARVDDGPCLSSCWVCSRHIPTSTSGNGK